MSNDNDNDNDPYAGTPLGSGWRDSFGWALARTLGRAAIASPVMLLALALCLSFVGLPLGFPLMMVTGLWITAPIRRLPTFSIEGDAE